MHTRKKENYYCMHEYVRTYGILVYYTATASCSSSCQFSCFCPFFFSFFFVSVSNNMQLGKSQSAGTGAAAAGGGVTLLLEANYIY